MLRNRRLTALRAGMLSALAIGSSGCFVMGYFAGNSEYEEAAAEAAKVRRTEPVAAELEPLYEPVKSPRAIAVRFEGDHAEHAVRAASSQLATFHEVSNDAPVVLEGVLEYNYKPVASKHTDGKTSERCIATLNVTGSDAGEPFMEASPEGRASMDVAVGASPQGAAVTCREAATRVGEILGAHLAPYRDQVELAIHSVEDEQGNQMISRAFELFSQGQFDESEALLREVRDSELSGDNAGWAHFNLGLHMRQMRRYDLCAEELAQSVAQLPPDQVELWELDMVQSECQSMAEVWFGT